MKAGTILLHRIFKETFLNRIALISPGFCPIYIITCKTYEIRKSHIRTFTLIRHIGICLEESEIKSVRINGNSPIDSLYGFSEELIIIRKNLIIKHIRASRILQRKHRIQSQIFHGRF